MSWSCSSSRRSRWGRSAPWWRSWRSTGSAVQADRHGHRRGLRLGHGRQHPGHVPDRLLADRRAGDEGGAAGACGRAGPGGDDLGDGLARRLGGDSARASASSRSCPPNGPRRSARSGASARRRETPTTTQDGLAWVDESNYYYIKVDNEPDEEGNQLRTLVLDNLIHGYFILGHPERLDYDYEHIYALVAFRAAQAGEQVQLGLVVEAPRAWRWTRNLARRRVRRRRTGRRRSPNPRPTARAKPRSPMTSPASTRSSPPRTRSLGIPRSPRRRSKRCSSAAAPTPSSATSSTSTPAPRSTWRRSIRPSPEPTSRPPDCPQDTTINTTWGDARQFVERNQDKKQYDVVFGDAFNDFSVPWHLTTNEFNDKIAKMMSPTGVYMINIIDAYESDAEAIRKAERRIAEIEAGSREVDEESKEVNTCPAGSSTTPKGEDSARMARQAHRYGGFLGSWTATAKLTFPHVYIFGTNRERRLRSPRDVRGARVQAAARPGRPRPSRRRSTVLQEPPPHRARSLRAGGRERSSSSIGRAASSSPTTTPPSRICSRPSPRPAATTEPVRRLVSCWVDLDASRSRPRENKESGL